MNEQQQSQKSSGVNAALILMIVGAILFFIGIFLLVASNQAASYTPSCVNVYCQTVDNSSELWSYFCGGVLVLPIGGVLFLIGLVIALYNVKSRTSAGATIHADSANGKSDNLSSLADYHQTPSYAPSTLPPALSTEEMAEIVDQPPSKQGISRRTVMIGLASLGVAATVGITAFKSAQSGVFAPSPALFTYQGHSDDVTSLAWSPDGKHIVSTSSDSTAQVWDPLTGKQFVTFRGHDGVVNDAAWSPDGRFIASCGWLTVQIWDAITGNVLLTYRGHTHPVYGVAWSPDGTRIASVGENVQVWDAASGKQIYSLSQSDTLSNVVAWSPDNRYLASCPPSGFDVHVHNASTGETIFDYIGHTALVDTVTWSPDGQLIASGSLDNTVRVWQAGVNVLYPTVYIYHGHSDVVNKVAWSPDSKRIASASGYGVVGTKDNTVQVWDATTGEHVYIYKGHSGPVTGVTWSPNSKYIASSSADKTVQVWLAPFTS